MITIYLEGDGKIYSTLFYLRASIYFMCMCVLFVAVVVVCHRKWKKEIWQP